MYYIHIGVSKSALGSDLQKDLAFSYIDELFSSLRVGTSPYILRQGPPDPPSRLKTKGDCNVSVWVTWLAESVSHFKFHPKTRFYKQEFIWFLSSCFVTEDIIQHVCVSIKMALMSNTRTIKKTFFHLYNVSSNI